MKEKWPKFEIYKITDGAAVGLLAQRRLNEKSPIEREYFYFLQGGLTPTYEIKRVCNKCNPILGHADEKRLMEELMDYAVVAEISDDRNVIKSLKVKSYGEKGFSGAVDHLFGRSDSPLRHFFVDAKTFKKCVLDNAEGGKTDVIGCAERFDVFSPHALFPEENFDCLKHISKKLEYGFEYKEEDLEWFPRKGPVAADFDCNRIFQREERLKQLKNLLIDNNFSLLEGNQATGKSVMVLNLAYNLYDEGLHNLYYFDCAEYRTFDQSKLTRDIRSVKGLFIIENIHLELSKIQWIYSEFKNAPDRHILFTARPTFRKTQNSFSEDLTKIRCLSLKTFEQVDELIEYYSSHRGGLTIPNNVRDQIKKSSRDSLWLLAYTLKGYDEMEGHGSPFDWYADGVKKDLSYMERLCPVFPRILVALSPLYKNEVLTVQKYLIHNLGIDISILKNLVQQGEITEHEEENYTFYGLVHSAHADSYWEHGKKYLEREELREIEEFIYNYATSGVPNGLKAVTTSNRLTKRHIFIRLNSENKLKRIVQNETGINSISNWLYSDYCQYPLDSVLMQRLAEKISASNDFYSISSCFFAIDKYSHKQAKQLWEIVNKEKLVLNINKTTDFFGLWEFLNSISIVFNKGVVSKLIKLLNVKMIGENIVSTKHSGDALYFIATVFEIDDKCGLKILKCVDMNKLSANLVDDRIDKVFLGIGKLFEVNDELGGKLWDLLDKKKVAYNLSQTDAYSLEESIKGLFQWRTILYSGTIGQFFFKAIKGDFKEWKKATDEFVNMLNLEAIYQTIRKTSDDKQFASCLAFICRVDKNLGAKLIVRLGFNTVLQILHRIERDLYYYRFIYIICFTYPEQMIKRFITSVDTKLLVQKLSRKRLPSGADICLCVIGAMDKDLVKNLCDKINNKALYKQLKHRNNMRRTERHKLKDFIKALNYINKGRSYNIYRLSKRGFSYRTIPGPISEIYCWTCFWNQVS